jgi:8-oxo-dGDP phosphatase
MSCQPIIGNADYPQDLYLAQGAEHVGEPEVDETAEVR